MKNKEGKKGCNLSKCENVYRWRVKDRERLSEEPSVKEKKKINDKTRSELQTFHV